MSYTVELLPLAIAIVVPLWCIGFVTFFLWKLRRDEAAALIEVSAGFADALYLLGRRRRAGGASFWFEKPASSPHQAADQQAP